MFLLWLLLRGAGAAHLQAGPRAVGPANHHAGPCPARAAPDPPHGRALYAHPGPGAALCCDWWVGKGCLRREYFCQEELADGGGVDSQ